MSVTRSKSGRPKKSPVGPGLGEDIARHIETDRHERIQLRAYELSKRGSGSPNHFWFLAEQEITREDNGLAPREEPSERTNYESIFRVPFFDYSDDEGDEGPIHLGLFLLFLLIVVILLPAIFGK